MNEDRGDSSKEQNQDAEVKEAAEKSSVAKTDAQTSPYKEKKQGEQEEEKQAKFSHPSFEE